MNIQYNTAKLAKEKGFIVETIDQIHNTFYDEEGNLDTLPYYMNHYDMNDFYMEEGVNSCLAPTQSELQKWLRDVHSIEAYAICIRMNTKELKRYQYCIISDNYNNHQERGSFTSFEQALEEGLISALNLI